MQERRTLAWFSVLGFFAADYARYGFMTAQYAPASVQPRDPTRDAARIAQLGYPK